MNEKNKGLPPIDVVMGNDNQIGHIGHKITFQAPPPPPNGIYQHDQLVGEFDGDPSKSGIRYHFAKLFVSPSFEEKSVFSIQGIALMIESVSGESEVSFGGMPPLRTLWNVTCRLV